MHYLKTLLQKSLIKTLLIGLFFCFQFTSSLASNNSKLHTNKTWLQLLYYDKGSFSVTTNDFYLSKSFQRTPLSELNATIREMSQPFKVASANNHAICKFPSRYLFLKQVQALNLEVSPYKDCPNLIQWAKPKTLQSVSIVLVTGYLGNPASSFGHVLFKVNNSKTKRNKDLLNQAVNFGAIVPDNENGILYSLYGLFGGYEAAFTAKNVYEENHIYLDKELRDMWEYKLNLNKQQLHFIVAHVWEILGKKYQYYFIDKNCAYRMAELLTLVSDTKLKSEHWQIPSSLFFTLQESTDLIQSIEYIPSRQSILLNDYELLTPIEQQYFKKIIIHNQKMPLALNANEKIRLSNLAIKYYQYKIIKNPNNKLNYEVMKKYWLVERLNQKAAPESHEEIASNSPHPPTTGHKPSLLRIKSRSRNNNNDLLIGISPSYHDNLNIQNGRAINTSFIALDSSFLIEKNAIKLDKIIIAKVAKYLTPENTMLDETGLSWSVEFGYQTDEPMNLDDGFYIYNSIGKAVSHNKKLSYLKLNSEISQHSQTDNIRLSIESGIYFKAYKHCFSQASIQTPLSEQSFKDYAFNFSSSYLIDKDNEIRLNIITNKNEVLSTSISLNHYW